MVAIVGAGAIGGYLAGALADAGKPVTLCARTPFERLEIEEGGKTRIVPVEIVARPEAAGRADWILLTTKAQDTAGAAPWLERLADSASTIVVVQNGVEHAQRTQPVAGDAKILPAIIYCAVERTAPGHVVHHGSRRIVVPRGEGGAAFAGLMEGSGFEIEQSDDFVTAAWTKLLSNIVGNPITALTMRRSEVLREPLIVDLARGLLREAIAAGRAAGAKLGEADIERVMASMEKLGSESGSSMLYDRLAGRPLEHDHLTGAVVRAAERHGVDVPLNRAILALLQGLNGALVEAARR